MVDQLNIWERPEADTIYMITGWRQWADAGSISSSLPRYLIQRTGARQIGELDPAGFYLFQIPGTHHLVRPVVEFDEGYPESLESRRNEIYYSGDDEIGVVFFIGDEPHLTVERYVDAFLDAAKTLGVERIVGFGGVYGELPYDKERTISSIYSQPELREELEGLAVNFSDYNGGASIGSYICKRASERGVSYISFYAFVPTYDFSNIAEIGNTIRIENDFMAWLGVMRRVNHMLNTDFDLTDLEEKSDHLVELVDAKVEELEATTPELSVRDYMERLSEEFTEELFEPLDDVWEEELRRLLDDGEATDS